VPPALAACSQLAQRHKQKGEKESPRRKSFLTIEWKNYSVSINISLIIHSPFLSEEEQQKNANTNRKKKTFWRRPMATLVSFLFLVAPTIA
jgi:hypothetical protein